MQLERILFKINAGNFRLDWGCLSTAQLWGIFSENRAESEEKTGATDAGALSSLDAVSFR
jgi:hypothetical protein